MYVSYKYILVLFVLSDITQKNSQLCLNVLKVCYEYAMCTLAAAWPECCFVFVGRKSSPGLSAKWALLMNISADFSAFETILLEAEGHVCIHILFRSLSHRE